MFTKLRILTTLLIMLINSAAYADLAIIGHPGSETGELDIHTIRKLFIGERDAFPNGHHATPINHTIGSPDRNQFFSLVLSMPEAGYKRHWRRKIAAGGGNSPEEFGSYDAILKSIASTPGSIGYIDSSSVDDSVKVLLIVSDFNSI